MNYIRVGGAVVGMQVCHARGHGLNSRRNHEYLNAEKNTNFRLKGLIDLMIADAHFI